MISALVVWCVAMPFPPTLENGACTPPTIPACGASNEVSRSPKDGALGMDTSMMADDASAIVQESTVVDMTFWSSASVAPFRPTCATPRQLLMSLATDGRHRTCPLKLRI